jgi:hypothetical protein
MKTRIPPVTYDSNIPLNRGFSSSDCSVPDIGTFAAPSCFRCDVQKGITKTEKIKTIILENSTTFLV